METTSLKAIINLSLKNLQLSIKKAR